MPKKHPRSKTHRKFRVLYPAIRDFDALEIEPCAVVGDSKWGEIVEPCGPEDAHFWTVYGHYRTGGVDALRDFPTAARARAFHDELVKAFPHLGEPDTKGGRK